MRKEEESLQIVMGKGKEKRPGWEEYETVAQFKKVLAQLMGSS